MFGSNLKHTKTLKAYPILASVLDEDTNKKINHSMGHLGG